VRKTEGEELPRPGSSTFSLDYRTDYRTLILFTILSACMELEIRDPRIENGTAQEQWHAL
jgi:hypothetical protein